MRKLRFVSILVGLLSVCLLLSGCPKKEAPAAAFHANPTAGGRASCGFLHRRVYAW